MNLPQNLFDSNVSIQTFLCQPDKTIIGEIIPYDYKGTFKFNSYSEISFSVDRYYNDLFDGKTKINPYYDLIESLRVIYIRGVGHFVIQDVSENTAENESKSVTCFSLEYTTGHKYLESFYVNTGEEASIEVMYNAKLYGIDYNPGEDPYSAVDVEWDEFDPYQRYYIKEYKDKNSWNAVEKQVLDADHFKTFIGENSETTLYIKTYQNVRFYWPTKPELSLLHNVFDRIPEWEIGHVDKELQYQERTFSEDRTSVYDFLYNTAAETLDFVMVWDSINGVVNFYKTTEDGITANEEVETQWDTDVFISKENLASTLDVKYSTDDIKTKLKISGSDGLEVRDVNLGQNYILNLSYYNTPSWMGEDLHSKYNIYNNDLVEYAKQYKEFISDWSAVYNEYSDLMNYVPVESRAMLVGDEFEKLYCVYNQYLPASKTYNPNLIYYKYDHKQLQYIEVSPQPTTDEELKSGQYYVLSGSTISDLVKRMQDKLENIYKVDQINGKPSEIARTDDILLTLENAASDSAIIRVRYDKNGKNYRVYRTRTDAVTGVSNTISFSLEEWIEGKLTADYTTSDGYSMNLSGFKIKSIGTLGAYFCLAKDETQKENLEDYGIRLLQEKQDIYTKIFITQTAGSMNKEDSQCIASDELPQGDEYPDGTKWLDTDTVDSDGKLIMKIRKDGKWESYTPDGKDYEDYTRFNENYTKLQNVQAVLSEKQLEADYLLNGIPINAMHLIGENVNLNNLLYATIMHCIALDNNYYVMKSEDWPPKETPEENDVCFLINHNSFEMTVLKYINEAWANYNPEINITLTGYNKEFGYITFILNSDESKEYATYTIDGTPYISYSHSQGICLAKMNVIKEASDMNNYFTEQELVRLSPFIREDEFSDSNFLLTTYESEEEEMNIKQELLEAGEEELKKICQPKLSFSATMANILAIPEFAPIKNQFKLGNFIRVGIRDDYVKRARLLEVQMNFEDPSDFSATFGDLITTKSEIDKHADLLSMAVTAGKSVASNQSKWQKGADKATELDNAINDGLRDAALSIGAADGQSITWDKYGIRGRKLIEGTTDQYYDEQFALINNKLAFTTDNWRTSRAVVGEFEVEIDEQKQRMYGLLADALIGGYIQGTEIRGGNLRIGDGSNNYFQVDENGDVQIVKAGKEKYASADAMTIIDSAYKYSIQISHTGKAVFSTKDDTATMTAKIYRRGVDATDVFKNAGVLVYWEKNPSETNWVPSYTSQGDTYSIIVDSDDIQNSAQISCYIDPTDEQLKTIESKYND